LEDWEIRIVTLGGSRRPSRRRSLLSALQRPLTAVLLAATLLATAGLTSAFADEPQLPAARPNIVMFYIDDVAPHDGRLWSDAALTPTIKSTFVDHGTSFSNAIGENPLCCPARGNLLTGLHTHNNGVSGNDARLFDPTMTIATGLHDVGYETMWMGKYLNHNDLLNKNQWAQHAAPWDFFDITYGFSTRMKTKTGATIYFKGDHVTNFIANRTVDHILATPSDKPIFTVMSLYNLHDPNIPMPLPASEFAKCDGFPAWNPPNYNEADVSDKPAYVRNRPLLPYAAGWPMDGYCREMLGVDTVVKRLTDALSATGRLDNTLLVFTADNGMTWGQHRIGQEKNMPYSTPVPLYMTWPARWGAAKRVIDDPVSNIDFAPTFCDAGGCSLGPYPTGQAQPDGLSMLPLLDGDVSTLDRDALLEVNTVNLTAPKWSAIRTTSESELGRWHYVEYATGERELYDLTADPWELVNLTDNPAKQDLQDALHERMLELLYEGRVASPDAMIAKKADSYQIGYNHFAATQTSGQTLTRAQLRTNQSYSYRVTIQNHRLKTDSISVGAVSTGSSSMSFTYLVNGVDRTVGVTGAGFVFPNVPAGETRLVIVRVTVASTAVLGDQRIGVVSSESLGLPGATDVVTAIARR
jgi:N-acetylglucosamine-6-sulfatase